MTPLTINDFNGNSAAWQRICSAFPDRPLVQSWAHGESRRKQGSWQVERCLFNSGSIVVGVAQAMIRPAPFGAGQLTWIARGPVHDIPSDRAAGFPLWTAMAEALRDRFASGVGSYLRIAPPFLLDDRAALPEGFTETHMDGWASAILDLAPSLDDLRAALKGKWRNGLNKAERVGVTIMNCDGQVTIDEFADAHDTFMANVGADGSVTGTYIKNLHRAGGDGADLRVYSARLGDEIVGRLITAHTGVRVEYLASHMTEAGKKASAGQAMLWSALAASHAAGAQLFDVGGMDAKRTPKGIFDFKDGLRGAPYRLAREIDCCGGPVARLIKARTDMARAKMGA